MVGEARDTMMTQGPHLSLSLKDKTSVPNKPHANIEKRKENEGVSERLNILLKKRSRFLKKLFKLFKRYC